MARKNVSVRLAAEGGKQVRAEMTGIGDAGAKGFKKISKEAEAANRKLAAFARAAKFAAVAAAGAALAAGVAMVRSGLQTIDAQAKLAASLGTTVASMQVLERAGDLAGVSMGEVEQATVQLTRRLSQAATGTGPAVKALAQLHLTAQGLQKLPLDERIAAIQDALAKYVPQAERAAVASQLFGDRASLTFGRIDSATLRQAAADVRDFGVATSEADAAQIQTTNDAISRLGLVWRGLANQLTVAVAPAMEAVANAMASATRVGGTFQKSIAFLGRNLGEIASIAGAFATFFAGKFVWAMGAAVLGLRGVTTGLVALKGALIRTGVGAAIVVFGELAYRTNLFGLAADKSVSAQTRMNEALGLYAQIGGPDARAEAIASTKAYIEEAKAKLANASATLTQMRADIQARENIATGGEDRPDIPGVGSLERLRLQTARDQVDELAARIRLAVVEIDRLASADPAAPLSAAIPPANGLAGALANASGQASVLSQYLAGLPGALAGARANIVKLQAGIAVMAQGGSVATASIHEYRAGLIAALGPLDKLHDSQSSFLLRGVEEQVRVFEQEQKLLAVRGSQVAALAEVAGAASGAGAAGAAAGEEAAAGAAHAVTGWDAVTAALGDYAASAQNISGEIGQVLVGAFKGAENAFRNFITTGKADFKSLVQSMVADLATLAFKKNILGPIARLLGLTSGPAEIPDVGVAASVHHAGGVVGGYAPTRMVSIAAFANAPRMHSGGIAGLRPDEVPAILQKGERVTPRGAGSGGNVVNININLAGANGDRAIEETAIRAVKLGLGQYDRTLPQRVRAISRDPRRVG